MATTALTADQRRAIQHDCVMLMHHYAVNADHHMERFAEVFTDDAVWIRPGQEMRGREAMQAFMDERHAQSRRENPQGHLTRHLITTSDVDALDPDSAEGVFYALVFRDDHWSGSLPVEMNTIELVVEYRTRFVRTPDGWRISRHQAEHVFRR